MILLLLWSHIRVVAHIIWLLLLLLLAVVIIITLLIAVIDNIWSQLWGISFLSGGWTSFCSDQINFALIIKIMRTFAHLSHLLLASSYLTLLLLLSLHVEISHISVVRLFLSWSALRLLASVLHHLPKLHSLILLLLLLLLLLLSIRLSLLIRGSSILLNLRSS